MEEDVLLWLRLAAAGEVWAVPDRLARCRIRPDSLSRDPQKVDDFERRLINTFVRFAEASEVTAPALLRRGPSAVSVTTDPFAGHGTH